MRAVRTGSLALAVALLATGCGATLGDPMGRQNALEDTQRRYTQLVRWGEIEKASEFVDPALRQDFLVHGPQLETLRITDFEIGTIERSGDEASVTVTYRAYSIASASEKPIREKQLWYRETGLDNVWRVRSELPEQLRAFEASP